MGKPKIRFKGYEDDWEQRKLGDVAEFSKGNGYSKGDLIESGTPIILYGRLYTKYETSISEVDTYVEAKEGSVYSKGGEVIVPASGETAEDIARATTVDKSGILLGGDLNVVMPNKDIDPAFLAISISNGNSQRELSKKAQGKSVVHIHNEEIRNLVIPFPNKMEQNKIVDYFANLDHLITLHQRKCEETKSLKKYMLQKMFPENGKCVPKIRFSGFSDDWEQCKVSEIGNIVTGSTPKTSISDNYGGEFLFVSPADIQENRYVDETITTLTKKGFDQGRKIREKASLFVSIGSTIGKVAQTSQESTTNQQINAVEPYDNFDDDFIFTSLENISGSIKAIASNQAVPIVNKTTFGETEIKVPSELAEQQKIGAYFRNLDHLITLHQHKCDELQKLKKFMLQNMFM